MDTSHPVTPPPSEREPVSLPAVSQPASSAPIGGAERSILDRVLVLLGLALAFLSASFVAHNSDLWFHLAAGRLLAEGKFTPGTDPFSYTAGARYWANQTWLAELCSYELYERIGGAGLVVLKALVVTILAGLLLRIRRPTGGAGLPVFGTTLAILAMSPRLLLQPACLSYFLLALTFWILFSANRRWWMLLVVFVVWVNVEEWFLLGPVLTGLFWLGERFQGQRRVPGWIVPAGLAVCLLNPHTFRVFNLPPELSIASWTSGLRQDVRFQALFASPWQPAYLHAAAEFNAAVLAYFALVGLGLISFLLHPPALRDWRFVVWLPFALLAAWQARAVPFFAVVAAPIAVINGQDFLAARRRERSPLAGPGFVSAAGRVLLGTALLALIFLTWPGWLAGYGREVRRVGWGVQIDPSLRRTAETLDRWRREKKIAEDERVFSLSPEVSQYACWFAPAEKHFFDHRYPLFAGSIGDYETVCRALEPGLVAGGAREPEAGTSARDWREVLRDHGVGIVVLYDREPRRMLAALSRLGSDPESWTLLRVEGDAVIFGWNPARPKGGFAGLAFDADRLAFGPPDDETRRQLPAAPSRGVDRLPPRPDFWSRLIHPAPPPTWESAAATVYLHYYDDSEAAQHQRDLRSSWMAYAAGLTGLPALPSAAPWTALQIVSSHNVLFPRADTPTFLLRDQLGPFFAHLTERPPALPLLAVRAARRTVAENPEDGNAWLRLGQAYRLVRLVTSERSGEGVLPPLTQIRNVQIITALEQAVRLDPDLEAAHHELAHLYGEHRYLDLALRHLREELRLSRRAGAQPGETAAEYAYRQELLERDVVRLEEDVTKRQSAFAVQSRPLQGDRVKSAGMAVQLGLPGMALEKILLETPPEVLGLPGVDMELELLLSLGRAEEVRENLNDERLRAGKDKLPYHDLPAPPGADGSPLYTVPYHWPAYEWLAVLQGAALGDYTLARQALNTIRSGQFAARQRVLAQLREFRHDFPILVPALVSGPLAYLPAFMALTVAHLDVQRNVLQMGEPMLLGQEADLCVLEGLLALEDGETDVARTAFAEAQQLTGRPAEAAVPFAGRRIAISYLRKLDAQR
jgi:hypothetical protein